MAYLSHSELVVCGRGARYTEQAVVLSKGIQVTRARAVAVTALIIVALMMVAHAVGGTDGEGSPPAKPEGKDFKLLS